MYWLSRLCLVIGLLSLLYSGALVVLLGWPTTAWALLVIAFVYVLTRGRKLIGKLGTARWASAGDLQRAGMLGAESGIIIGRLPKEKGHIDPGIPMLLSRHCSAKQACNTFFASMNRKGPIVRLPHAIHTAVFSPSGGGKGVSIVIPHLLTCAESCVVIDPKGENAKLTAAHRRKAFRHQIVLLDPFRVVTQTPDCFNPLDFIDKNSPHAIDECNDLAKALIVRTGEEREPHWNDSAEFFAAAVIAMVVEHGNRGDTRSLQMVRDVLSHPQKLEMAVKIMCESQCWGGMLARMGGQLMHFVDKEKSSTLTTVSRHLRFLDTPAIAESTRHSSFNPAGLRAGRMTIFLVLPPEHMRAQAGLMRLWIGSMLRAVVRGGLQE
jgi:type IV secretion system protein VirD4